MTMNASTIRTEAEIFTLINVFSVAPDRQGSRLRTMALIDGNDRLTGERHSVPGARRFWIGVASRDHVNIGVKGGFIQLNHGKQAAVRRLKAGEVER